MGQYVIQLIGIEQPQNLHAALQFGTFQIYSFLFSRFTGSNIIEWSASSLVTVRPLGGSAVTAAIDLSLTPIAVLSKDVDSFLQTVCFCALDCSINTRHRLLQLLWIGTLNKCTMQRATTLNISWTPFAKMALEKPRITLQQLVCLEA